MDYVYVVRYSLGCGTELVSCYASMRGAIARLQMMDSGDSFCEDESVTITKEEVISDEEASLRLSRVVNYHNSKNA